MNKEILKNIVTLLGKLLGILGLFYILYKLYLDYTFHSFITNLNELLPLIPVLLLLNVISILLGIILWHILLQHYTKKPFAFLLSYYYYAKTEIAKYLPGNIFHLIGRQAIAHKINISQKDMLKTSFLFTLSILVGTAFSSTLFGLLSHEIPNLIFIIILLSIIVTLVIIYIFYTHFSLIFKIKISLYSTIGIALQGIMLGFIVMQQIQSFSFSLFSQIVAIYIVSWVIGFVTPGASGGLGVREGTFILIASYFQIHVEENIIVFSVLLVRLINILTDTLLYLSSFLLKSKIH